MMLRMSLITLTLLAPVVATADQIAQGKTVDCYCTDKGGARVELGQTICLEVNGRQFQARCEMSQNVPMWREQSTGCLSS